MIGSVASSPRGNESEAGSSRSCTDLSRLAAGRARLYSVSMRRWLVPAVVFLLLSTALPARADETTASEKAGQLAYREGRFAAAVQLYTAALAETTDSAHRAKLHVKIAWTDFALGKEHEAATHLKAALVENPGLTLVSDYYTSEFMDLFQAARKELADAQQTAVSAPAPDLEATLAGIQQKVGVGEDLEAALADLDRLIAVYPTDSRLIPLRRELLQKLGRSPDEPLNLPTATSNQPPLPPPSQASALERESVSDLILQANNMLQSHQVEQALPLLREAVDRQPSNVAALDLLAEAAQSAARWEEAKFALKSALTYQKDNIELSLRLGEVYLAMGDTSAARDVFRGVIKRFPHSDRAWAALGLIEAELGKRDEALAKLQRALEENPLLPEVQLAYGELLLQAGKADEALQALRTAANLLDQDPQVEARLGQALLALGNGKDALGKLDAGVAGGFTPQDVLRARLLGQIEAGNLAEARRELASGALNSGTDTTLLTGLVALASASPDKALESFRNAARERPNDPAVLNLVGIALFRLARYQDAVPLFGRAAELAPKNSVFSRNLNIARTAQAGVDLVGTAEQPTVPQ